MKEAKRFNVIECQGTPYEIGQQYGEGCRDSLQKSLEINFGLLCGGYNISRGELTATAAKYLPNVTNFDPDLIEFIKGQAEGAGLNFAEAFALRCTLEIGPYYPQLSALCTSFAATGEATADGQTILGQNIDWYPGFPIDLLRIKQADGLVQLVLSLGGFAEYTLSSAGFGMCANSTLTPPDNYRLHLPLACYLPKAMRQKTIGDALGVFCQAARGAGYYHLASAEGDIVGIESVFDDFNILYPEKDILVHSNHYLTDRFKKGDLAYLGIPDSYLRVQRMRQLMDRHYGQLTPQLMMEFLADHNNHPTGICRHYDSETPRLFNAETLASFIMVPAEGKMYLTNGTPCKSEYLEYSI
jgi:isopenicillin-N N-acyltransferase-like protein